LGDWQYAVMPPKEALPKAKAAAMKALELDDGLSEAHTSLAFCLEVFDWNWEAADREFRRAIELNPGYATAYHWYAWHLILLGRKSQAASEMRKAENLDPLSLIINADLAELLLIAHFPDESIQQSRKTMEMDPGFALAHNQLGQAYLEKHLFVEAIAELQKAVQLSGGSPTSLTNLARAYAASNRQAEAIELLNDLKRRSPTKSVRLEPPIEMPSCCINNGFLTNQSKIHNRISCIEMSPPMVAVFDVDRLNAIFSPNWRCTSKICD